jgi:hypothetical protein
VGFFSRIEDTFSQPRPPEPRARGIDRAVTKGSREKIVEVFALGREQRFGVLNEVFEDSLLFDCIHELQCRDTMLRFDEPPTAARKTF